MSGGGPAFGMYSHVVICQESIVRWTKGERSVEREELLVLCSLKSPRTRLELSLPQQSRRYYSDPISCTHRLHEASSPVHEIYMCSHPVKLNRLKLRPRGVGNNTCELFTLLRIQSRITRQQALNVRSHIVFYLSPAVAYIKPLIFRSTSSGIHMFTYTGAESREAVSSRPHHGWLP